MADESKRNGPKLKRRRSEERDKKKDHKRIHPNKRKKEEKNNKIIQPQIPKTATDISSNWKLLQAVSVSIIHKTGPNLRIPGHFLCVFESCSCIPKVVKIYIY